MRYLDVILIKVIFVLHLLHVVANTCSYNFAVIICCCNFMLLHFAVIYEGGGPYKLGQIQKSGIKPHEQLLYQMAI